MRQTMGVAKPEYSEENKSAHIGKPLPLGCIFAVVLEAFVYETTPNAVLTCEITLF